MMSKAFDVVIAVLVTGFLLVIIGDFIAFVVKVQDSAIAQVFATKNWVTFTINVVNDVVVPVLH